MSSAPTSTPTHVVKVTEDRWDLQAAVARPQEGRLTQRADKFTEESRQIAISQLAYALWEQGGYRNDSAEGDWLEAERQITAGQVSGEEDVVVSGGVMV